MSSLLTSIPSDLAWPGLAKGFLHVDGVPMHDGIENAAAEAMAQFCMVELGQDAAAERRVVNVVKDVDGLGDPADFGERAGQGSRLIFHLNGAHDTRRLEMPEF